MAEGFKAFILEKLNAERREYPDKKKKKNSTENKAEYSKMDKDLNYKSGVLYNQFDYDGNINKNMNILISNFDLYTKDKMEELSKFNNLVQTNPDGSLAISNK